MTRQTGIEDVLHASLKREDFVTFVSDLVDSNPVVRGEVVRLTEYHDRSPVTGRLDTARLRKALTAEAYVALKEALSFADDEGMIVEGVKRSLTKFLMLKHHSHLVSESADSQPATGCALRVGALWFPASYHVLHARSWEVFGAGRNYDYYANDEFYGVDSGSRHMALVVESDGGSRIIVSIPISHVGIQENLKFTLINAKDGRPRRAIYGHPFVAGWRMVTRDTQDFRGHSISAADMNRIGRAYTLFRSASQPT